MHYALYKKKSLIGGYIAGNIHFEIGKSREINNKAVCVRLELFAYVYVQISGYLHILY